MNERGSEQHLEYEQSLQLKEGLNAIMAPEFGNKINTFGDMEPAQAPEVLQRLQSFLDEINNQGGEVVGVVSVQVMNSPENGMRLKLFEDRQIFIVKK